MKKKSSPPSIEQPLENASEKSKHLDNPSGAPCPDCQAKASVADHFVYAIGKMDIRFPTIGLEREYRQMENNLSAGEREKSYQEKLSTILSGHDYLARKVCYVLNIGNVPAYVVLPSSADTLKSSILAAKENFDSESYTLVIGRRGGVVKPGQCAGVLAPSVMSSVLYSFTVTEWAERLREQVKPYISSKNVKAEDIVNHFKNLFFQVSSSVENSGVMDTNRALNHVLMRHPGLGIAVAERIGEKSLQKIETKKINDFGVRKVVAVILTFMDRAGIPERLFCRVDVTDEFPFIADSPDGTPGPLGFSPYVEYSGMGML